VSVTLILKWMGGSDVVVASMASKSVTMPIAMAVTDQLGGVMSITSIVVIFTGVLGALTGGLLLPRLGIKSTASQGLAIGTASHAVGTASCYGRSGEMGAYSTIAMILNGVITAVLAPWLLGMMGF
jgi:putative effector of murein hydrolase